MTAAQKKLEQALRRASERERKRTPRMKVTGKGVQTLSRLMTTKSAKKRKPLQSGV